MKYCKYCGNPMGDRDLFCKKCGKKQDNNKINSSSDQPTSNRSGVSNNNKSPKSKGLIIGIIAGVIVLLVVLGVAAFIFLGKDSSESGRSKIEVSERKTAKDKEDTSDEEACDVIFDYQIKDNKEYAVITGVSEEGDKVWEIETAHVEAAQLQMVSEVGIIDGDYYYTEDGTLICIRISDGKNEWTNVEFGGSFSALAYDDDLIYLSGYFGPDLFVVSRKDGETVFRQEAFDEELYWPISIELDKDEIIIEFEEGGTVSVDRNNYELLGSSNSSKGEPGSSGSSLTDPYMRISGVSATSWLSEPQYGIDHVPNNVIDKNNNTNWVEDAKGQGIGEYIVIEFDSMVELSGFNIKPGLQASGDLFNKNSRPKDITVLLSDGSEFSFTLTDSMTDQRCDFAKVCKTNTLTVIIKSVYPGSKYEDTAITEIIPYK